MSETAIVSKGKPKAREPTAAKGIELGETTPTEIVTLPLTEQETLERFNRTQHLKRSLLDPKTDLILIAGKPYIKKSGWRKLQFAFNLTDELIHEEQEKKENKTIWRMWVRVRAPNGREVIGVGSASSDEKKFSHPDHDPYALCHTRSKNRAISDILGLGEVSAEEMLSEVPGELEDAETKEPMPVPGLQPASGVQSGEPVTTEGTKQPAEVPPNDEIWTWLEFKDQLPPDVLKRGFKQYPLLRELKSFGMINILEDKAAIVPEHPVLVNTALVEGFLVRKVLAPMKEKHKFDFELRMDDHGKLTAVRILGKLEENQVKELVSAARWAFERALEEKA
jgi:hypothetical protein